MLLAINSVFGQEKVADLTEYQKALRALDQKKIHAGLSVEKMLDLSIPTSKQVLGLFTVFQFELLPGYHGLQVIAKNGVLKCATEWSCTFSRTFFDELGPAGDKAFYEALDANRNAPSERFIGRWGWERPRRRDLTLEGGESPAQGPSAVVATNKELQRTVPAVLGLPEPEVASGSRGR